MDQTDLFGPAVGLAVLVRKARLNRDADVEAMSAALEELIETAGGDPERAFAGPVGAFARRLQEGPERLLEHRLVLMTVQKILDTHVLDAAFLRAPLEHADS